jgi:hypothetical protein
MHTRPHAAPLVNLSALIAGVAFCHCLARAESTPVDADLLFNPTGIFATAGQPFTVSATGSVDLAIFDGPYDADADGTITVAFPPGSRAYNYFTYYADPIGVPPVVGAQKFIISGGQLDGAAYGALVAGFSPIPDPTSLSDFPNGFELIGTLGVATAPSGGGYLFLAVNDINNTYDNSGAFTAEVSSAPEFTSSAYLVIALFGLLTLKRSKRAADLEC